MMANPIRAAIAGCAILLAACASSQAPGAPAPDRVLASSDQGSIRDVDHIASPSIAVEASPDSVLKLLPQVYFETGITADYIDPAAARVGNRSFVRAYKLGGTELHNFVGCGSTMTGPAADNYRIQMALVSTVRAEGAGSKVETELEARASDPAASKGWISCVSTGALETRINNLLARKVKG